jgi:hypothetical protein
MKRATSAALLALALCTIRVPAQTPNPWRFEITPYAWMLGETGTVGIGPLQTNVDLTFHDLLEALKFAAMLKGEARKGPWSINADLLYAKIGHADVVAIRGDTGHFNFDFRETMFQPMVGYTLGDETFGFDLLAGARYWDLLSTLDVASTNRPSNQRRLSRSWLDGIGGFRVRATIPSSRLRLLGYADGGWGGSHSTWQVYGFAGYDIAFNWTLSAGYRSLSVDYNHDNFLNHTRMRGPVVAASFHF